MKRQGHGPGTWERWERNARYASAEMRRMGSVESSKVKGGSAPSDKRDMLEKREKVECLLYCQNVLWRA